MGVSRVLVSSNKLGMVVEDEGLVTVNYKGGQVNKNQDQVKGLQYEGKLWIPGSGEKQCKPDGDLPWGEQGADCEHRQAAGGGLTLLRSALNNQTLLRPPVFLQTSMLLNGSNPQPASMPLYIIFLYSQVEMREEGSSRSGWAGRFRWFSTYLKTKCCLKHLDCSGRCVSSSTGRISTARFWKWWLSRP